MRLVTSTTEDIEGEPTDKNLEQIELEERVEKDFKDWNKQEELERLLEETSEFLKKHTRTMH